MWANWPCHSHGMFSKCVFVTAGKCQLVCFSNKRSRHFIKMVPYNIRINIKNAQNVFSWSSIQVNRQDDIQHDSLLTSLLAKNCRIYYGNLSFLFIDFYLMFVCEFILNNHNCCLLLYYSYISYLMSFLLIFNIPLKCCHFNVCVG